MAISGSKVAVESHLIGFDADFTVSKNQVVVSINNSTFLHSFVNFLFSQVEQESFLSITFWPKLILTKTTDYVAIGEFN